MAKELPYFKFEPGAWDSGNIQMCSHASKGVFADLCSLYWSRLGDLPYALALQKICRGDKTAFEELLQFKIFEMEGGFIRIGFLDEQLDEFSAIREKRVEAGKKGGKNRSLRPEIERINGKQFYVIYCYNDSEEFIKFGITDDSISRRFSGKMPYQYEVLLQYSTDENLAIERECCDRLRQFSIMTKIEFPGYQECYNIAIYDELSDFLKHRIGVALASLNRRNAKRREEKRREEKKKEKKREETAAAVPFVGDVLNAWNDWIKYRAERKLKTTPTTVKKQIQFLGGRGDPEIIQIINASIRNGWQGLFELKNNNNASRTTTTRINGQGTSPAERKPFTFD